MADKKGAFFDCDRFISRKAMTRKGLASLLDFKESTVGNWCSGTSTPNYSTIAKLIELGITAEELFGRENAGLLIKNSLDNATVDTLFGVEYAKRFAIQNAVSPEMASNIEFQEGLQKSIDAKVNEAVAKALKEKGL